MMRRGISPRMILQNMQSLVSLTEGYSGKQLDHRRETRAPTDADARASNHLLLLDLAASRLAILLVRRHDEAFALACVLTRATALGALTSALALAGVAADALHLGLRRT